MKRLRMKIEVSRFKDGKFKVIVHHGNSSYFWVSDLTECVRFDNVKDVLEALIMVDYWNRNFHERFEFTWKNLRNIDSNNTNG